MIVKKPPMGWNTWNTFGPEVNEQIVKESTDAFVELGLHDYGYEYIVIDDCWSEKVRDPETDRLVASHEKFPKGMRDIADYIHARGLKFGMYSCTGCAPPAPTSRAASTTSSSTPRPLPSGASTS